MAIYSERNSNTSLSFATDPEAQPMFISRVNGDPGLVGAAVGLSVGGHVTVAFDGTVTFDDAALAALSVGQQLNDSLIATVSDGLNEVDVTVNLEILGIQDTSNTTVAFGSFTRAGAGGIDTGGASITGGNSAGYFEVVGGKLVISAAGQGMVAGAYFLSMSDGSTIEISILPNRLDVTTDTEMIAACQAAEAINPGIDFEIVVRDGSVLGTPGVSFTVTQVVMAGQINDANRGVPNASYDPDHVATMSGGSITIRSETPLGATVSGEMRFFGCDCIRIAGLKFDNAADDALAETVIYSDDNNFFGAASTMYQLIVSEDNWVPVPTRGRIIVEQNLFTSPDGKAPGRWARAFLSREMSEVIFQDNETRKVYIGPMGKNTERWVTNRNRASLHVDDHFRCFEHDKPPASGLIRWEAVGNIILPPLDDVRFAGAHVDGFQYGHPNDAADYDLFLHKNHLFGQIPGRIWPGETVARQVQGFFGNMKDNGRSITGEIPEIELKRCRRSLRDSFTYIIDGILCNQGAS